MQKHIQDLNPYATYVPCSAHSLNLVGRCAVDCCLSAVNFFGIIQKIYNFFSAHPKRWAKLHSFFEPGSTVPKSLSETRWAAHYMSVSTVLKNFDVFSTALEYFAKCKTEKGDTRSEAQTLLKKMGELEFAINLFLWNDILQNFHTCSKALQDSQIPLQTVVQLYEGLYVFLSETTTKFNLYEEKAKELLPDTDYTQLQKRVITKKLPFSQQQQSNRPTIQPSPREKFKNDTFLRIMNALMDAIKKRGSVYSAISEKFSFLIDFDAPELAQQTLQLVSFYPDDLHETFETELSQFHLYMNANHKNLNKTDFQKIYNNILASKLETVFPNVEAIFRLYLSLMVSNCSGERSFSKLKKIKTVYRSTMSQSRLSSLALLHIETDILNNVSTDKIIDKFILTKFRRGISYQFFKLEILFFLSIYRIPKCPIKNFIDNYKTLLQKIEVKNCLFCIKLID